MWQRFTERARRAIFFAQEEATSHGVGWVGPECVLLGLIRDEEAVAVRMLRVAGVAVADLRARLGASLSAPTAEAGRDLQLTPTAKRAIDTAYDEARALGDRHIGTEHLLLGLAQVESVASAALAELGVTVEALRRHAQIGCSGAARTEPALDGGPDARTGAWHSVLCTGAAGRESYGRGRR